MCINIWNLSRCPILVLVFVLQQIHLSLQKVVVIDSVASLLTNYFFLSTAATGMVDKPMSFSAASAQNQWLCAQPLWSWAEVTCQV